MAIIISPAILQSAAKKFAAQKIIAEAGEELEAHILNFYEDLNMPLVELNEVIDSIIAGDLGEIQEKMDGQNITFTVQDGSVLFFSKGGGLIGDRAQIESKYANNDSVRNAFTKAYDALASVAVPFQDSLFQNGKIVVESALLTPDNANTIVYDQPAIRFIRPVPIGQAEPVDNSVFENFVRTAQASVNEDFAMGPVPYLTLAKALEDSDTRAAEIKSQLLSLVSSYGLSLENTMGDLLVSLTREKLESLGFIPNELLDISAAKVVTGKGSIARPFKKLDPAAWPQFQELMKSRNSFLAEAIIPIEKIVQRIGSLAFKNLEFSLKASNREDLLNFIRTARVAFESGQILGDPKQLEGIRVALARIGDSEDLFDEAVEGIVFKWKGKTRKLTGMFTPINRLRGFFAYGKPPAQIQNTQLLEKFKITMHNLLAEGGKAFKDSEKRVVTRQSRTPRADVAPIVSAFQKEILDPLGLSSVPVGSTGTDTETVGDIDITVDEPSRDNLFKILSQSDALSQQLVPGVERVKKLPGIVAVLFPVPGSEDLIQIDVVPSENTRDTAWIMKGGSRGGAKGLYRNLLMSYIVKKLSDKESAETNQLVKYSIATPGGLRKRIDGEHVMVPEQNPDKFLPMMGINASRDSVATFEKLVDYMRGDTYFNEILPGYRSYIDNSRYLQSADPKIRSEAEHAIRYIEGGSVNESLKRTIVDIICESVRNEKIIFKRKFLAANPGFKSMMPRGEGEKEVRLGLSDASCDLDTEHTKNLILQLGYTILEEILPGAAGSKSSKFKTYLIVKDAEPLSVVFGCVNKGEKFEAELHKDLTSGTGPLGDELLTALEISRGDIVSVEPFAPARRRPLTGNILDVGAAISDITLNVNTPEGLKKVYISLKDPAGGTFANQGYSSAFEQSADGTISVGSHALDDFVLALGVDKQKIAQGINDYAVDSPSDDELCSVAKGSFDPDKIAAYLASALGYGYVYARQIKDGYHIINLDSPEKSKELVGKPVSVNIRYARNCGTGRNERSKGTTATIETDNGAKYSVAIRNASGKLKPSELKIQILRYPNSKIERVVKEEFIIKSVVRHFLDKDIMS